MPHLIFQSLLSHCTLITPAGIIGEATPAFFKKASGLDVRGKVAEVQAVAIEELGWWALRPTQSGTFMVGVRKWLTEEMLDHLMHYLHDMLPGLQRAIIAEKHGGWRVHEINGGSDDVGHALDILSRQRAASTSMSLVQRNMRADEYDALIQRAVQLHLETGGIWNDSALARFSENDYLWSLAVLIDHQGHVRHFGQRFALFIGCPEMAEWDDHSLFHKSYQDYFSWRAATYRQQLGQKTPLAQKIRARVSPPNHCTIDLEYTTVLLPFKDSSGRPCLVNVASFKPLM